MGFKTAEVAYPLTVGSPGDKSVLAALAFHACDDCGLTWAGVNLLSADTEMGKTRLREALANLVAAGHLRIYRFPHGGRGLSTEYVVLPQHPRLSTAPCGKCVIKMKKPPQGGGFAKKSGENPPHGGAFPVSGNAKATGSGPESHRTGGDHQSENNHQSGSASPPVTKPSLSLGLTFEHPANDPAGLTASQDALRAVRELTTPRNTSKAP